MKGRQNRQVSKTL